MLFKINDSLSHSVRLLPCRRLIFLNSLSYHVQKVTDKKYLDINIICPGSL